MHEELKAEPLHRVAPFSMMESLHVGTSLMSGRGVFTTSFIPRRSVVIVYFRGHWAREVDYRAAARLDKCISQSGIRYVGDIVFFNRSLCVEDYMNHSDDYNILYHCGVGFAARDILAGEELTADYRLYLPEEEIVTTSNGDVVGLPPDLALLESTRRLAELFSEG